MKECLHCKKEFEPKKDTAKFCSTSCRVMNHQKKGKKKQEEIKPVQMQVLYNAVLEMVANAKFKPIDDSFPEKWNGSPQATSHTTKLALGIEKTFQQHMNDLPELETEYDYRKKYEEIEVATNLSEKQKELLFINIRKSNI